MSDPDVRSVHFELSLDDYRVMLRQVCARGGQGRALRLVSWTLAMFVVGVAASFSRNGSVFLAGLVVGFLMLFFHLRRQQSGLLPRANGAVLCSYVVRLGSEDVELQTPGWQTKHLWQGVLAFEEVPTHYFLRVDTAAAYTIPKRAFADADGAQQFAAFARERLAAVGPGATASRSGTAATMDGGWTPP